MFNWFNCQQLLLLSKLLLLLLLLLLPPAYTHATIMVFFFHLFVCLFFCLMSEMFYFLVFFSPCLSSWFQKLIGGEGIEKTVPGVLLSCAIPFISAPFCQFPESRDFTALAASHRCSFPCLILQNPPLTPSCQENYCMGLPKRIGRNKTTLAVFDFFKGRLVEMCCCWIQQFQKLDFLS